MNDYLASGWREIFRHNGLEGFEDFWNLEADWFEPPNQRRGGWSGVARVVLRRPGGGEAAIFLKRQENHIRKSWRHPLRGEPTFRAEARNLRLLEHRGVEAPQMVLYAERRTPGGWQVVLATEELAGQRPLDVLIERWHEEGWAAARPLRRALIPEVAALLRRFHALRQAHNALHAKHIFIDEANCRATLIDLEKMRPRLTRRQAMLRDLDTLNRRTFRINRSDRLRFLLAYLEKPRVDDEVRRVWRALVAIRARKDRRKEERKG